MFKSHLQDLVHRVKPSKALFIADNTIVATELTDAELASITKALPLLPQEHIEVVYSNSGDFTFQGNVIVGISNFRFFKLERDNCTTILRKEIAAVKHIQNGTFEWDKVECILKSYKTDTIGVFHKKACAYLCNYLQTRKCEEPRTTSEGVVVNEKPT